MGAPGIAVLNPNTPQEIQFEEHKLLIVYGSPLEPFEFTLESHGVGENEGIKFITEAEHIHSSSDEFAEQFSQLKTALGLDGDHADAKKNLEAVTTKRNMAKLTKTQLFLNIALVFSRSSLL